MADGPLAHCCPPAGSIHSQLHPLMTLPNWVTPAIATLSLAVSGLAVYFTQLRGASINLQLLSSPDAWSLQLMRAIEGAQHYVQPLVSDATHCQVSGTANALVSNDGPKGGAIWAIEIKLKNLPAPCIIVQPPGLRPVVTLPGNSSEPSAFDFVFRWPIEDALPVFTALRSLAQPISLAVSYHHHGFLGKEKGASSEVSVVRADMWSALLDHAQRSYFDIAQIAARPQLDQIFAKSFRKLDISDEDRQALWQGLWMALQQPEPPLDYRIEEAAGSVRLLFRIGYAVAVHADGSRATLDTLVQEHREFVSAATNVLVKVRGTLGLGG